MKYERLTKRVSNNEVIHNCGKCPKVNVANYCSEANCATVILNRLADLEDKIESGKLVELPCKIGDTLYGISAPLHIEKAKLSEVCYEVVTKDGHYLIGHFGISLFTDKSQAEARLKELEGGL